MSDRHPPERMMHPVLSHKPTLWVGVLDVEGHGLHVATWDATAPDGAELGFHASTDHARQFAKSLIDHSAHYQPFHDALMAAVDRIEAEV